MAVIVPTSGTETITHAAGDTVVIKDGVSITTNLALGIGSFAADLTLRHRGTIAATDAEGIYLGATGFDAWINATGSVSGFHGVTIRGGQGRFINDGDIYGENVGAYLHGATDVDFVNRGEIRGVSSAMAVWQGASDSVIRNFGLIEGTETFSAGVSFDSTVSNVQLINAGTIRGEGFGVSFQGDGASLSNTGLIEGAVVMGGHFGLTITNRGDILTAGTGTAVIYTFSDTQDDTIKNFGTLGGDISLLGGDDYLFNAGGAVITGEVDMGAGDDIVFQRGGAADTVFLGAGRDVYNGALGGRALVAGESGDDRIIGGAGDDGLDGGDGADAIKGNAGADNIAGREGRDVMWGGADADQFFYYDVTDSLMGRDPDVIRDFETGVDQINLQFLPVGPLAFNGTGAFTGGGQGSIRYIERGAGGVDLRIDADGNGTADMRILILGSDSLTVDDFVLAL